MQVAAQAALAPLLRTAPQPGMTHLLRHGRPEGSRHPEAEDAGRHGQPGAGRFLGAVRHERGPRLGHGGGLRRRDGVPAGPNPEAGGQADARRECCRQFRCVRDIRFRHHECGRASHGPVGAGALVQAAPQPDMSVSSGTGRTEDPCYPEAEGASVTGSLALADFTGRFGTNEVRSLGTAVDFDVGMTAQQVQIRKLTGKLTQGANAGGSFRRVRHVRPGQDERHPDRQADGFQPERAGTLPRTGAGRQEAGVGGDQRQCHTPNTIRKGHRR